MTWSVVRLCAVLPMTYTEVRSIFLVASVKDIGPRSGAWNSSGLGAWKVAIRLIWKMQQTIIGETKVIIRLYRSCQQSRHSYQRHLTPRSSAHSVPTNPPSPPPNHPTPSTPYTPTPQPSPHTSPTPPCHPSTPSPNHYYSRSSPLCASS
jgi:hypothetical protein